MSGVSGSLWLCIFSGALSSVLSLLSCHKAVTAAGPAVCHTNHLTVPDYFLICKTDSIRRNVQNIDLLNGQMNKWMD